MTCWLSLRHLEKYSPFYRLWKIFFYCEHWMFWNTDLAKKLGKWRQVLNYNKPAFNQIFNPNAFFFFLLAGDNGITMLYTKYLHILHNLQAMKMTLKKSHLHVQGSKIDRKMVILAENPKKVELRKDHGVGFFQVCLIIILTCLCILLSKKIRFNFLHNVSLKYFQAIHTAAFYKKSAFKMFNQDLFMFINLQVSSDQNKNWSWRKIGCLKVASENLQDYLFRPRNPPKIVDNFRFWVLFCYFLTVF